MLRYREEGINLFGSSASVVHETPGESLCLLTVAPSLAIKPRDQTVTENKTVVFSCAATGNPTPQITWIKDGITVGTANNLTFAASRSDSGKYWCSANNSLGDVKQSADLDVQCK